MTMATWTTHQVAALRIARLHGCLYAGKGTYDGVRTVRVASSTCQSLLRQGLISEDMDPNGDRYYRLTPDGFNATDALIKLPD